MDLLFLIVILSAGLLGYLCITKYASCRNDSKYKRILTISVLSCILLLLGWLSYSFFYNKAIATDYIKTNFKTSSSATNVAEGLNQRLYDNGNWFRVKDSNIDEIRNTAVTKIHFKFYATDFVLIPSMTFSVDRVK